MRRKQTAAAHLGTFCDISKDGHIRFHSLWRRFARAALSDESYILLAHCHVQLSNDLGGTRGADCWLAAGRIMRGSAYGPLMDIVLGILGGVQRRLDS
jgi:hypothetical protein